MNSRDLSRRRLVALGITGTAVALAGCGAQLDEQPDDENQNEDESTERLITVVVDLDENEQQAIQAEFQEAQQEIQEAYQNDDINESEAQERLTEAEAEAASDQETLVAETVGRIEEHVDGTEELSVTDVATDLGVLLVKGEPAAALDLLSLDSVAALLPENRFEELQE